MFQAQRELLTIKNGIVELVQSPSKEKKIGKNDNHKGATMGNGLHIKGKPLNVTAKKVLFIIRLRN